MKSILLTGGAGFIGSHTLVELLQRGYNAVVVDNLSNSCERALDRVRGIAGKDFAFYRADVRDRTALDRIFSEHEIGHVIHFAGLKAVGESCRMPLEYYDNNIGGTIALLESMRAHGVRSIVFSSSATVYGMPERLPLTEDCRVGGTTNPYGASKYYQEGILTDLYKSDARWTVVLLRYFNPVGAHPSGDIGEDPKGVPNNLMPYVAQVASGKLDKIRVFGDDYPTKDGTGVRDYIHVVDLARGHIAAIEGCRKAGLYVYNLGTGIGYSVLDMIRGFEKACGKSLPYEICPRRAGDIAECYADASKAKRELGWQARFGMEEMCRDQWNWQKKNPNGYGR